MQNKKQKWNRKKKKKEHAIKNCVSKGGLKQAKGVKTKLKKDRGKGAQEKLKDKD